MSVYASRVLATDWQIAPRTPVLTAPRGITGYNVSVNFDDYGDTAADMGDVQATAPNGYVNIPPVFTKSTLVTDFTEFDTAYWAAGPGEAIVIQDGTYDWGIPTGWTYGLGRNTGTIENPLFILAQTPGGVTFSGAIPDAWSFQTDQAHHVIAGLVQAKVSNASGFIECLVGWLRVHKMTFNNPRAGGKGVRIAGNANNGNCEIDNCTFDGEGLNEGSAAIQINTRSTAPTNQDFRLHHNKFFNLPEPAPITSSREAINMGTDYTFDQQFIIENNLMDVWNGEDELFTIKSSLGLVRNNSAQDCTIAAITNRSGYRVAYHGNWQENGRGGVRVAGGETLFAFNYISPTSTGSGVIKLHQGVDSNDYKAAQNGIYINNVFSRMTRTVKTEDVSGTGSVDATPTGNLFDNNAVYSTTLPHLDDLDHGDYPDGNYRNTDLTWTEAQWRANNTWGTNTYINADLSRQNTILASHFDGPGTDLIAGSDYVATDVFGQPSIIKMPSWWKLP